MKHSCQWQADMGFWRIWWITGSVYLTFMKSTRRKSPNHDQKINKILKNQYTSFWSSETFIGYPILSEYNLRSSARDKKKLLMALLHSTCQTCSQFIHPADIPSHKAPISFMFLKHFQSPVRLHSVFTLLKNGTECPADRRIDQQYIYYKAI